MALDDPKSNASVCCHAMQTHTYYTADAQLSQSPTKTISFKVTKVDLCVDFERVYSESGIWARDKYKQRIRLAATVPVRRMNLVCKVYFSSIFWFTQCIANKWDTDCVRTQTSVRTFVIANEDLIGELRRCVYINEMDVRIAGSDGEMKAIFRNGSFPWWNTKLRIKGCLSYRRFSGSKPSAFGNFYTNASSGL